MIHVLTICLAVYARAEDQTPAFEACIQTTDPTPIAACSASEDCAVGFDHFGRIWLEYNPGP